ncbi:MAG: AAA family ATPase [Chloroflexi bacterium]|nr:AAA family ATPase [Chloroflexota bacterium]
MNPLAFYIPMDRRRALAHGETLPDHTFGAALFADIAGFTPLAETLAQSLGAQRGAEELTRQLNLVYDALITQVHNYRGSVIGFAGDAITCWFDVKDEGGTLRVKDEKIAPDSSFILHPSAFRATTCASAMQDAMRAFPQLAIKIGIATGPARRLVGGDPQIQLLDTLAGETIRAMARAAESAERGAIVHDLPGSLARKPGRSVAPIPWDDLPDDALRAEQIRPWILPALGERLAAGQEQFTTELRAATALFVQFPELDYDHDENAPAKLDAYIRDAQHIIQRYDASLIQLTLGDKGSFFYAVFGAPIAHDDDPVRAVQAALELISNFQFPTSIHIGIAQGTMRVGAYGGATQRAYGAIGDATNLAARLMQAAPAGEIRCDDNVYRAASKRIAFETLPPVRVKGKAGLVRVYRPVRGQIGRGAGEHGSTGEIIGRRAEIAIIEKILDETQAGATRVLIVEGEAGIGKSRLVDKLKHLTRTRGLTWLIGNGQSIEQHTPYRAWRDVFNAYFDLDGQDTRFLGETWYLNERRARVESLVAQIAPEHAPRLPVFNDVLGLGIPENDLTQSLDANLRQQNVSLILTALLRAWTLEHPLVLVLEDAHWLDELSWQLAIQIARALANAPLLCVLVNRPLDENSAGQKVFAELRALEHTQTLALTALAPEEIVALIAHRLNVAPDALPAPLIELVQARANGNPFFAEELVFNLRDTGIVQIPGFPEGKKPGISVVGDLETASRTLPNTLHGLILARLDRLPPQRQFVIKVAAVIGRAFAFAPLHHVVNRYVTMLDESLKQHLAALTHADFTFLETLEPELTYLFKHIITQEAAYQTLLFSQRRELHRLVAEWYEDKLKDEGTLRGMKDKSRSESFILHPSLARVSLSLRRRHREGKAIPGIGGGRGGKNFCERCGDWFLHAPARARRARRDSFQTRQTFRVGRALE